MKVAVFSTKPYDRLFLEAKNPVFKHDLMFYEPGINATTFLFTLRIPPAVASIGASVNIAGWIEQGLDYCRFDQTRCLATSR